MQKWSDRRWGAFAALFTIVTLAALWLWALTPKAHGQYLGALDSAKTVTIHILLPLNDTGAYAAADSAWLWTSHEAETVDTFSTFDRTTAIAADPKWGQFTLAGSPSFKNYKIKSTVDSLIKIDASATPDTAYQGHYTGTAILWTDQQPTESRFSFEWIRGIGSTVGVNWANVVNPSTAVDLSATTIRSTDSALIVNIKASDTVNANLIQISGDATSLSDFKDFVDDGYVPLTNAISAVNTNGINASTIADGAIDAATFAAGAIDAAAIGTGAIDDDAVADGAIDWGAELDSTGSATSVWNHGTRTLTAGGATFDANVVQVSGDATAADNLESMLDGTGGQKLTLRGLNIIAGAGDSSAVVLVGNGAGHGLSSTGGATGSGALFAGGATSGSAMRIESDGSSAASALRLRYKGTGAGIDIANNTAGSGVGIQVVGGDEGITVQSGANADAITVASGTGATNALELTAGSTGGNGLTITGSGASSGVSITGGATGPGATISAGATSGPGMKVIGTGDSSAILLVADGAGSGLDARHGSVGGGYDIVGDHQFAGIGSDLWAKIDSAYGTGDSVIVDVSSAHATGGLMAGIADSVWKEDTTGYNSRATMGGIVSELDDSLDSQAWAGTGSSTGLDSATTSRIIQRTVWGRALGAAGSTDSTTKAQRVIGGSIAGDSINDHAPHDDNWGATGSALGTGALSDTVYAVDTSGTDTAIPGAYIEVRNASGTLLGEGATNGSGYVIFGLPQSTSVTFSGFLTGYTWSSRTLTTESGTTDTDSLFGYNIDVGSPSAANLKRVYVDFELGGGDTLACVGAELYAELITPDSGFVPYDTSTNKAIGKPLQLVARASTSCRATMDLIPNNYIRPGGTKWKFTAKRRGQVLWTKTVSLSGTTTADLMDL